MLGQAARLLQSTSQLHDVAHAIEGHAPAPVQSIWHAPVPQVIAPHEPIPAQSMVQPLAIVQSMSSQALLLLQRTVQSKPGGHAMSPHCRLALQLIWQVIALRLHDVQTLGHAASAQ
jgi:hypothetical protein